MEINSQQVAGWLRTVLAAGGPLGALILAKSGISQTDWAMYLEVILVIVPPVAVAIWSWFRNRVSTQAKLVSQVDGQQVHVDPKLAPASVVSMANDPAVKDVVPMEGPPRDDKATGGTPPAADAEHA